jgi:prevent-host-death family protein
MCYLAVMAHKYKIIPVSELKNKLLEIVREVQAGRGFRISKGGNVVAMLTPARDEDAQIFGFAKAKVLGDIDRAVPEEAWGFDLTNLGSNQPK